VNLHPINIMDGDLVFYDIETMRAPYEVVGGWDNPEGMDFGIAVAYHQSKEPGERMYHFFGPGQKQELIDLLRGRVAVTFNGVKFDNRVLFGNLCRNPPWRNIDLLRLVLLDKFKTRSVGEAERKYGKEAVHGGGQYSLDGLAEGTMDMHKIGTGARAPQLIAKGKWPEVYSYCLHDVRLLRGLFERAYENGVLRARDGTPVFVPAALLAQGTDLEEGEPL